MADVQSPETYIGYDRAENFVSPGGAGAGRGARSMRAASRGSMNGASTGDWTIGAERAALDKAGGAIVYPFPRPRPASGAGPGRGRQAGPLRGDHRRRAARRRPRRGRRRRGEGTVTGDRLYQLVRQNGAIGDRTFEIQFLDPGVQAYAFTFG